MTHTTQPGEEVDMTDQENVTADGDGKSIMDKEYVLPDGTRKRFGDFTRKDAEALAAAAEKRAAALMSDTN